MARQRYFSAPFFHAKKPQKNKTKQIMVLQRTSPQWTDMLPKLKFSTEITRCSRFRSTACIIYK